MKCTACGNPVEKDAPYCLKCGARIEPLNFWQKLLGFFQRPATAPRRPIINIQKTVNILTTDADGQRHEYHSLDEVPPKLRAEIEKVEAEGLKGAGASSSAGLTRTWVTKKSTSVFRVKDTSGSERTYQSLNEVPPELRAELEKMEAERLKESESLSSAGPAAEWIGKKSVSVFKVRDASGNERTYHSLDEMPPEIRSAFEQAQKQTNG